MAPEFLQDGTYETPADCYSMGIILWELFCEQIPTLHISSNESLTKVSDYISKPSHLPTKAQCPEDITALMEQLWATDPKKRPSAKDALSVLM